MKRSIQFFATILIISLLVGGYGPAKVQAQPGLRAQVWQRGDFVLIGNTLAHDCDLSVPTPVVGTVGNCGANTIDTAPDVFWRADSPGAGQAHADKSITAEQVRSTAQLNLPAGATVTHAFLYWAATTSLSSADSNAVLERPDTSAITITASTTYMSTTNGNSYMAVADVTSQVQNLGSGPYRVSGVEIITLNDTNNNTVFASWWMVVLYRLDSDPMRMLSIYDGLDFVSNGSSQNIIVSGFQLPSNFGGAKLGIVSLEGDANLTGDSLTVNGSVMTNAVNPAINFFNSSRSYLGMPLSVVGDLPQLTGAQASQSGIDMDVINIEPTLSSRPTSLSVVTASTGDMFALTTLITSIPSEVSLSVTKTGNGVVTSTPEGINCGVQCDALFDSNTSVTLAATADAGSIFLGWSGACTGKGTCQVSQTNKQDVTATFVKAVYIPLIVNN